MSDKEKKKNTPVLRDVEDKKLYQALYQRSVVKFRLSKEEAALVEAKMIEEDYVNLSENLRSKVVGEHPERDLNKRIRKKSKWAILATIKQNLLFLNSNYRYVAQVMPKDIKAAIANQNVKQLIELDRKWLAKLQESIEEVNNNLLAIMCSLGIDTEGPILKSNEDLWDNDPDEQKKARMIWELSNNQER